MLRLGSHPQYYSSLCIYIIILHLLESSPFAQHVGKWIITYNYFSVEIFFKEKILRSFYFSCIGVLPSCLTVYHMSACWLWSPEEDIRFLNLEIHIGVGSPALAHWKDNQCLKPLSHLSSSELFFFFLNETDILLPGTQKSAFLCLHSAGSICYFCFDPFCMDLSLSSIPLFLLRHSLSG